MYELSAPNIEVAPLEPARSSYLPEIIKRLGVRVEEFLESERAQLPLWFVVAVGLGIVSWVVLPGRTAWIGLMVMGAGLAMAGIPIRHLRMGRAVIGVSIGLLIGLMLIGVRSEMVGTPRLERPLVISYTGKVERVQSLAARGDIRLTLAVDDPALPPRVRLTLPADEAPEGLARGAVIEARARLAPPPPMAFPGTHDYARDFWFWGIGATGRALGEVTVLGPAPASGMDAVRARLDEHVRGRLPEASGAIATALVTGDQHAVSEEDAEAMRRSGLTHLLSVSGLHIAAVVGAAMLLTLKLLALSERAALRFNLILVAAAVGALTGIGYTWLTGMQVPTVRSCIAAVLVLAGIAMGRDAISLRLVATGALAVMIVRPETIAGASFQMSFAAVTAIIALHSVERVRAILMPRDDPWVMRIGRSILSLLLTGLAVEAALVPIALFHFHKSGLYGVLANLFAIPWTTFVIMPLEAMALLLDVVGLGAPFWALTGWAIDQLLGLARWVAGQEGAVTTITSMPRGAFALMMLGGLWACLWRGRARLAGTVPFVAGAMWMMVSPPPDILLTGDGRHLVIVERDGAPRMLRERSGDYMLGLMSEAAGFDGDPLPLSSAPNADCSRDACMMVIERDGRQWSLMATRSQHFLRWDAMVDACARVDIVVSERRLPKGCTPRWMKLDRETLARTGGVSITLGTEPKIDSVANRTAGHPWAPGAGPFVSSGGSGRQAVPGSAPDRGGSAAPHIGGWPDRGGSSAPRAETS